MSIIRLNMSHMVSQLRRELVLFELTEAEFFDYLFKCFDYYSDGMNPPHTKVYQMCCSMQFSNLGPLIKPDLVELSSITTWFLGYVKHVLQIYEQSIPNLILNGEFNGRFVNCYDNECYIEIFNIPY
jgi:hypothetical protein